MRKIMILLTAAVLCVSCSEQFNAAYLLSGGAKVAQAATLSDAQIQSYVSQYVQKLDAENTVLPETSPYVKRVRKMTSGITSVNGTPLNFKVYKTNEVNAFACADGSVRIYSGLLDAMTDDEALGVVGHEIGHGGTVAVLTASQLGDLGEALMSASFSRKQETAADDYGYDFLKSVGKNPWAMAMAFEELQRLSSGDTASGTQAASGSSVGQLFSTHPATADRISRMSDRATKDGYKRPSK